MDVAGEDDDRGRLARRACRRRLRRAGRAAPRKECEKQPQWSKSTARRSFSASRARRAPRARRRRPSRSTPRAGRGRGRGARAPWSRPAGGRSRPRSGRRSTATPRRRPSAARPRRAPGPRASRRRSPASRSRSRQKLQRAPGAGRFDPVGPLEEDLLGLLVAAHLRVDLVFVERPRREVAEVLVDPVAGDAADRPPVPPGAFAHLRDPGLGDVPVVGHVVVVPEHRGRDDREEPADQRLAPALLVEPGVLLEVGDLAAGLRLGAAPRLDLRPRLRAALVDVDLVAEQEEEVGPRAVAADDFLGEDPERVDLVAAFVLVFGLRVGLLVGDGDAAGAEGDVERALAAERAQGRRRQRRVGLRPAHLAVEPHVIGVLGAGLQPFDPDQRVVVALDREGRLDRAEHGDLAGRVGLDPEGRLGVGDVAEQGSEDEIGHPRIAVPCRGRRLKPSERAEAGELVVAAGSSSTEARRGCSCSALRALAIGARTVRLLAEPGEGDGGDLGVVGGGDLVEGGQHRSRRARRGRPRRLRRGGCRPPRRPAGTCR